jgi:hypothetical protein
MQKIKYPAKPWRNGQRAELINGMEFIYSSSVKNWVPVTPGFENKTQLSEVFGVETIQELNEKFVQVDTKFVKIDSDIKQSGRIWKTENTPANPNANDVWIDIAGSSYYYDANGDTWIQF